MAAYTAESLPRSHLSSVSNIGTAPAVSVIRWVTSSPNVAGLPFGSTGSLGPSVEKRRVKSRASFVVHFRSASRLIPIAFLHVSLNGAKQFQGEVATLCYAALLERLALKLKNFATMQTGLVVLVRDGFQHDGNDHGIGFGGNGLRLVNKKARRCKLQDNVGFVLKQWLVRQSKVSPASTSAGSQTW